MINKWNYFYLNNNKTAYHGDRNISTSGDTHFHDMMWSACIFLCWFKPEICPVSDMMGYLL